MHITPRCPLSALATLLSAGSCSCPRHSQKRDTSNDSISDSHCLFVTLPAVMTVRIQPLAGLGWFIVRGRSGAVCFPCASPGGGITYRHQMAGGCGCGAAWVMLLLSGRMREYTVRGRNLKGTLRASVDVTCKHCLST